MLAMSEFVSSMSAAYPKGMNADEFLGWSEGRPGRYELVHGEVFAMSAEQAQHALVKGEIFGRLREAARGRSCQVFVDGMAVRVGADTIYEPDVFVRCGPPVDRRALAVGDPVVVVEVVSPSSSRRDAGAKLADYFALPSVVHYLIADPERRVIVHHRREGGRIETAIVAAGLLALDPPGLGLSLGGLCGDAEPGTS